MSLTPDPTFYPSPGMAMKAAPEHIAYVSLLNVRKNGKRDAMMSIHVHAVTARSPARWIFPTTITNCILRLERVQRMPLPAEPAPAYGASLPDCSGHRILPNSHSRY